MTTKNLGAKGLVTPLPVLIIATYDESGVANAMNVAWGGQCGPKHVVMNLSLTMGHKTNDNLKLKQAFTVSYADAANVAAADYVGIASGKKVADKLQRCGLTTRKSEFVDAPVINEFPLTAECKVVEMTETSLGELRVVGEIMNVVADERILDAEGKVSLDLLQPIVFDSAQNLYRVVGKEVGGAWKIGNQFK